MKKSILFLASAAAILAGCAREATIETPETGRKHITIQATVNPETRTTVDIADGVGTYAWADNEQIAVFESTADAATPFTVNDPENGYFDGTIEAGNTLIGAVSPKSAVTEMVSVDGEVEYTLSLSGVYNQGETNAVMVAGAPETIESDPDSEPLYKFQFKHAAGLMKVTYVNLPVGTAGVKFSTNKPITGTVDLETLTGVEITNIDVNGKSEAFVLFDDPVTEANTTGEFYIPVPTGSYTGFTICLVDDGFNPIPGTTKSKSTTFTVERADIIRIPTVTLQASEIISGYFKVTDVSEITAGDYLIVYEGDASHDARVLSGIDTEKNLGACADVKIENNTIDGTSYAAYNIEASKLANGHFTLKLGSVYLAYTSSETSKYNNLWGVDDATVNGTEWILSVDEVKSAFNTGRTIQYNYNSGNDRFAGYAYPQSPITLFKKGSSSSVSKLPADISFAEGSPFMVPQADAESFTAPQLNNPNGLTISWSIEGDDEIAVFDENDGSLLLTGDPGTITVTATSAETSVFAAGEASYTITVTTPVIVHGSVTEPVALENVVGVINNLSDGGVTTDFYYVGGTVSVASSSLYSGGKLTFTFGDETIDIKAYNCLSFDGEAFVSKDDVEIGDYVVVYGNLEKYVKNNTVTYEVVNGQLAKLDKAPYFTATASPLTFESEGGNATLVINANVPWTATINNGGSLKIGDANACTSVSGTNDTEVTVIIPENAEGATYTISFTTTSDKVTAPDPIQITQNAYVDLVEATATFTGKKSGGMTGTAGKQTGVRRNVTAVVSSGLADATGDHIRVYKNATLTLSVPDGAYITAIEFIGVDGNPVSNFAQQSGFTTSGNNGSWSGSAQSVVFTASEAQVKLARIDVTYHIAEEDLVAYVPAISVTSDNPMSVANTASTQTISYVIDDAPNGASLTGVTKSEGANWISNIVYTTSGTVTFDVAAQETGAQARSATLTLKYTGATDVPVTVNQAAGPSLGDLTSTLTFTTKCNGSGTADDGVTWTVTSDGAESNFDSDRGIHYGTNNASVQYIKLSTSGISGTITKVVVNASAASQATVDVKVGGSAFGGNPKSLLSSAANYTFEGSASGEIVVTVTKPEAAKKALYVKSIAVTYNNN